MEQPKIACFTNSYGRFGGEAALAHLPAVGIEWLELPIRTTGGPGFFGDLPLITIEANSAEALALQQRITKAGLRAIELQRHQRQSARSRSAQRSRNRSWISPRTSAWNWSWAERGKPKMKPIATSYFGI